MTQYLNEKPTAADAKKRLSERFGEFNPDKITFKHAWIHYQNEMVIKRLSKETVKGYERFHKKFVKNISALIPDIEEKPVSIINDDAIKAMFIASMEDERLNIQTQNYYLRSYKAFGKFCEEQAYLTSFRLKIREVEPELKELYSPSEIDKLKMKPDYKNYVETRDYTIVQLIMATGARANTIRNIKIKDVNIDERRIIFNTTKAHKTVSVPLEPAMAKALAAYIYHWRSFEDTKPDEFLFASAINGEQLSREGLSQTIAKFNKSRGVEKTSMHLLRRTFAHNWLTTGGGIAELSVVMTHSDISTTKRYANFFDSDIEREMSEHSMLSADGNVDVCLKAKSKRGIGKR